MVDWVTNFAIRQAEGYELRVDVRLPGVGAAHDDQLTSLAVASGDEQMFIGEVIVVVQTIGFTAAVIKLGAGENSHGKLARSYFIEPEPVAILGEEDSVRSVVVVITVASD